MRPGAKMGSMLGGHHFGTDVERPGLWDQSVLRYAQPVTAAATLLALIWGIAAGFKPVTEPWVAFLPTALGLVAWAVAARATAPLAARGLSRHVPALRRMLLATAAFTALLIMIFWQARAYGYASLSLWLAAFFLGLGLVAPALLRLVSGRPTRGDTSAIAACAAMLVMFSTLASGSEGYGQFSPIPAMRVILVSLAFVVVASQWLGWPRLRGFLQPPVALFALIYLLVTLAFPLHWGTHAVELGAMPAMAWIVGAGLLAELLVRYFRPPNAEVLIQRVDQLSRSRRGVLDVQASELRRIERDLHDGAQVRLVALSIKLGRAEDRYRDDPQTAALLREAREDATAAIRELRELARGIAPPVLANRGLEAAVQSIAQRPGTEVKVTSRVTRRPQPAVERVAYFVVAEALTNAIKHAPGARVEITLDERGGDLFVEITDFGPGGADPSGGGLTGLRQRVEAIDGTLHVTSPEGVGTQVEAVLPCGQ